MSSSLQSCPAPRRYRCIPWGNSLLSVDAFGSISNAWGRLYDFFSISGLPEPSLPPTSPITLINPALVRIVAPTKLWINLYAPKVPSRLRNELLPEDIPEEIPEKLKIRLRICRGESCRRDKWRTTAKEEPTFPSTSAIPIDPALVPIGAPPKLLTNPHAPSIPSSLRNEVLLDCPTISYVENIFGSEPSASWS
jgi:hypothetical protein